MSTTTDPFGAWSDRWQAQGGDTLPALGYVPGPIRELQEPAECEISEEEARRLTHSAPLTPSEWLAEGRALVRFAMTLIAAVVCVGVLLTWGHSGIGAWGLLDSMRECLGTGR